MLCGLSMLCCQQEGSGILVKCWLFLVQGLNLSFSLLLYISSCPFFLLLLIVLAGRERKQSSSNMDSSALAGLPAGVISCDDLSVSALSQFATDWLKNICHQVIQVLVAVWAWRRADVSFPCPLEERSSASCNRGTAVFLTGSWHQWTHAPRCEGAEVWNSKKGVDVPSLKEGISLKWNCIPRCDSIRILMGNIGWVFLR